MIQALIFDCFGVIKPDRMVAAYTELGGDYVADKDFIDKTIRAANIGMIPASRQIFADRLGVSIDTWMAALEREAELDYDLLDFIAEKRTSYKTAVLSNASKGRIKTVVGSKELQRCFDVVVESGSLGFAKPDAEIYEYTATQLGLDMASCLFTDDREAYCIAARAARMQAITYVSFAQFKQDLEHLLTLS